MKILLFLIFFIVLSVAEATEEEKFVVGNPDSQNKLNINKFYIINQSEHSHNFSTTNLPENYETFSPNNNFDTINSYENEDENT